MRSKELRRNLDVPSQEKIMARQSLSAGHCRPPCHWIGATNCSSAIRAGRHRTHEECPPHGLQPPFQFPGAVWRVDYGNDAFFSLGAHMSRTTLQAGGCQGRHPHAHMHRASPDRPTHDHRVANEDSHVHLHQRRFISSSAAARLAAVGSPVVLSLGPWTRPVALSGQLARPAAMRAGRWQHRAGRPRLLRC